MNEIVTVRFTAEEMLALKSIAEKAQAEASKEHATHEWTVEEILAREG